MRMMTWLTVTLLTTFWVNSCSSSPPVQDALTMRIQNARRKGVYTLAPDLFIRAENAYKAVLSADSKSDRDASKDNAICARRLLEAAEIEAQRVKIERRRMVLEQKIIEARAMQARHRKARLKIERKIALIKAANVASKKAHTTNQSYVKTSDRKNRSGPETVEKDIPNFKKLLDQAHLLLATAMVMGVEESLVTKVNLSIEKVEKKGDTVSIPEAEAILASAQKVLGRARARNPGPTQEEMSSLMATARQNGLSATLSSQGLIVELSGVFQDGSSRLTPLGRQMLKRSASILRLYPHGDVVVRISHQNASSSNLGKLAKAQGVKIIKSLSSAIGSSNRLQFEQRAYGEDGAELVKLVFIAYRPVQ